MSHVIQIKRLIICFFLVLPLTVSAASIKEIRVSNNKSVYSLYAHVLIEADSRAVMKLITDYENLVNINPYLLESRLLSNTSQGAYQVYMLTRACVMVVCYRLHHVQDFTQPDDRTVYSKFIPELSDFKTGWTRWHINETAVNGNRLTELTLELEVEPDFFVVPIVGPKLLKEKLIEIITATLYQLEKQAQAIKS